MANNARSTKVMTPTTGQQWINPADNPAQANATITKILSEASSEEMPMIELPPEDIVTLPGGLVRKDAVIKSVQVKELTGSDEESLAKASQSLNPFTFLDRLLKCGVVRIGEEPPSSNEKLLAQMLIGDREALILGIRKATYGDGIEIRNWSCPQCAFEVDGLTMDVSDVPVRTMTDPLNEIEFKVDLRKGGYANVRLATGADQVATFDKAELSQAQRETIILSRCVISLVNKTGREQSMAGFPSLALQMSVSDRHTILKELRDRQPGPKYDKVEYTCPNCNTDVNVTVTIGNLFLDFGWI